LGTAYDSLTQSFFIISSIPKKNIILEKPALVLCLKTEAEPAAETSCYLKRLDDGQNPKKDMTSVIN
jgi:hypothetical protein